MFQIVFLTFIRSLLSKFIIQMFGALNIPVMTLYVALQTFGTFSLIYILMSKYSQSIYENILINIVISTIPTSLYTGVYIS